MSVFVLDQNKVPLSCTSSARARLLLSKGDAAVFRRYPFTIILKRPPSDGVIQPLRLKIDPGSKTTGIALVDKKGLVVFGAELQHRGQAIKASLDSRRALRSNRRSRKTRHRKPRFLNRTRPKGWLAPSLRHRVETTMTWVNRLRRFTPIESISQETVRFDIQKIKNPEIRGVEYQQGEQFGFWNVREYVLYRDEHRCKGKSGCKNKILNVHHIESRKTGGNAPNNLITLCVECHKAVHDGTLCLTVKRGASFRDAAAVNSTRNALLGVLKSTGLPVEEGNGAQTKFNRIKQGLPKAHWIDAACVGESGTEVYIPEKLRPLLIRSTGHGSRQMCRTDKYGFPKAHRTGIKKHFGFETGDIVRALVPKGKNGGVHVGRVTVRVKPSFKVGGADGIHPKHIQVIQRRDGYAYRSSGGYVSDSIPV